MRLLFLFVAICVAFPAGAQVKYDRYVPPKGEPKNIIIMIGHGMGMDEITAGALKNNGQSNFSRFKHIGFIQPWAEGQLTNDPFKQVSNLAYGDSVYKTNDGDVTLKSLYDWANAYNMMTGMVVTGSLTDKVPASFLTMQALPEEEIAKLYLEKDIDIIVGGGANAFGGVKKKGNDLITQFHNKGYDLEDKAKKVGRLRGNKVLALVHEDKYYSAKHRGDYLSDAAVSSLLLLRTGGMYGFLSIIESDQIARAAEENDVAYLATEMQDFDMTVGKVLDQFINDDQTLLIVMGDGATGGLTLTGGNPKNGSVSGKYHTKENNTELVPVFANGPGAEEFMGMYSTKEMYKKIIGFLEKRK